ncbi:MAG: hypothetical protein HY000_02805 [Planctomycetes bacterium]|nr:hypothetical protein [Planctomycetota bacterium]
MSAITWDAVAISAATAATTANGARRLPSVGDCGASEDCSCGDWYGFVLGMSANRVLFGSPVDALCPDNQRTTRKEHRNQHSVRHQVGDLMVIDESA